MKREHEFSTFRELKVLIISWNLDSAKPDTLTGTPDNVNFLHDALSSVDSPDIIAFGLQELIDLESRKMAAKTVLLANKNKNNQDALSQRVTSAYKKWYDRLIYAVRVAMPPDCPYTVIHTESLVGLFSCIFVKESEKATLKDAAITTVKRGMGGRYGNKVCFKLSHSTVILTCPRVASLLALSSMTARSASSTAILRLGSRMCASVMLMLQLSWRTRSCSPRQT